MSLPHHRPIFFLFTFGVSQYLLILPLLINSFPLPGNYPIPNQTLPFEALLRVWLFFCLFSPFSPFDLYLPICRIPPPRPNGLSTNSSRNYTIPSLASEVFGFSSALVPPYPFESVGLFELCFLKRLPPLCIFVYLADNGRVISPDLRYPARLLWYVLPLSTRSNNSPLLFYSIPLLSLAFSVLKV